MSLPEKTTNEIAGIYDRVCRIERLREDIEDIASKFQDLHPSTREYEDTIVLGLNAEQNDAPGSRSALVVTRTDGRIHVDSLLLRFETQDEIISDNERIRLHETRRTNERALLDWIATRLGPYTQYTMTLTPRGPDHVHLAIFKNYPRIRLILHSHFGDSD